MTKPEISDVNLKSKATTVTISQINADRITYVIYFFKKKVL